MLELPLNLAHLKANRKKNKADDSFCKNQTHLKIEAENRPNKNMNEPLFDYIPNFTDANGKRVLGRDVTETFGVIIAKRILADNTIDKMTFPRLRLQRLFGLGYLPDYYREIANLILGKAIRVYETKDTEKIDFLGVYNNSNKFIFAQKLVKSLDEHFGTVIHEVTHAIQDLKKWRESDRDREVDAHFAAAFFMVQKKQEFFLAASKYNRYIELAKKVLENNADGKLGYFKTFEFGRKVTELQTTINEEYGWKFKDDLAKLEDFHKRQRWDGIAA